MGPEFTAAENVVKSSSSAEVISKVLLKTVRFKGNLIELVWYG